MANVKVFADKQMDGRAKNYVSLIYRHGGIKIMGLAKGVSNGQPEISPLFPTCTPNPYFFGRNEIGCEFQFSSK